METGNITAEHFKDDDAFLLKYVPGDAPRLRELRATIHGLNTNNLELVRFVLLVGPTGTGKSYVARVCAAHRRWLEILGSDEELDPGKNYPGGIAPLDDYLGRFGEKMLPAIPEGLVESELFGHVKGAFSGAVANNAGLFRDEGYQDILLDEIGEAPPFLQAKLLGVLEGRPFTPVGGNSKQMVKCDKRIFMATNRDLQKMVADHEFRKDLFFRIRRHTISMPPLSANPQLIPQIAMAILDRLGPKKFKGKPVPTFAEADKSWLQNQQWGGNVRELEEVIELWVAGGCVGSLQTIASTRHFGDQTDEIGRGVKGNLSVAVRSKIEEIVAGKRPSARTIQGFIDSFTSGVKAEVNTALCAWYRETKPSSEILGKLFPEMKLDSVRSQMSRGRRPR